MESVRVETPHSGEHRIIQRFAWIPVMANGEIKWLEWMTIHQSYDTEKYRAWSNDWFESK
ncbi:hypothetical protein SDC9_57795 [bioreactor metagenome]|uniref:Uncharacterized protein n=1 Tax=bioreactor metagenome TaxID=1076179 RepID=A0A644X6K5_9ZZZZ